MHYTHICHTPPHKILQNGRFTRGLATNHSDLGQVQRAILAKLGECILQLIHQWDEVFHAPVPHVGKIPGGGR